MFSIIMIIVGAVVSALMLFSYSKNRVKRYRTLGILLLVVTVVLLVATIASPVRLVL